MISTTQAHCKGTLTVKFESAPTTLDITAALSKISSGSKITSISCDMCGMNGDMFTMEIQYQCDLSDSLRLSPYMQAMREDVRIKGEGLADIKGETIRGDSI